MIRTIKCLGWMLVGIGAVVLALCGLLALTTIIILAAGYTTAFLGLANSYSGPIAFGYIMLGLGISCGAALCWDHRND